LYKTIKYNYSKNNSNIVIYNRMSNPLISIVALQFKALIEKRISTIDGTLIGCEHYNNFFSQFSFIYFKTNLNQVIVQFNNDTVFTVDFEGFELNDIRSPQSDAWRNYKSNLLDDNLYKFHTCYENMLNEADVTSQQTENVDAVDTSGDSKRPTKVIHINIDVDDDSTSCSSDSSDGSSDNSDAFCSCNTSDVCTCTTSTLDSDGSSCDLSSDGSTNTNSTCSSIYAHKKKHTRDELSELSSIVHRIRNKRRHTRHRNYGGSSESSSDLGVNCTCKECLDDLTGDDCYIQSDVCISEDITCDTVWDQASVTICGDVHVLCGVTLRIKPFTNVCFSPYAINEDEINEAAEGVCIDPIYAHLTVDAGASIIAYDVNLTLDLKCGKQLAGGLTINGSRGILNPSECEPSEHPCKLEKVTFCNLGNKLNATNSLTLKDIEEDDCYLKDITINGSGSNGVSIENSSVDITNLYVCDAFSAAINASGDDTIVNISGVLFVSGSTQGGSVIEVSDDAVVNVNPCTFICLDSVNDSINGVEDDNANKVELGGHDFNNLCDNSDPISESCKVVNDPVVFKKTSQPCPV
jgi:hypothetical protein